jgi:hypothetical protein
LLILHFLSLAFLFLFLNILFLSFFNLFHNLLLSNSTALQILHFHLYFILNLSLISFTFIYFTSITHFLSTVITDWNCTKPFMYHWRGRINPVVLGRRDKCSNEWARKCCRGGQSPVHFPQGCRHLLHRLNTGTIKHNHALEVVM